MKNCKYCKEGKQCDQHGYKHKDVLEKKKQVITNNFVDIKLDLSQID